MFVYNWGTNIYQRVWGPTPLPTAELVYQLDQLEVRVDPTPIGGYRGKVGTLTIHHVEHKVFTDWNAQELQNLTQLVRTILKIREQAGVDNNLIFARQDRNDTFKLSLVSYPKCHWIEKIQGLIHVIFGSPTLKQDQVQEIAQFYQQQFSREREMSVSEGEHREGKPDPFCNPTIIQKQLIANLSFEDHHYNLLADNRPKGRIAEDPHLLIMPKEESGHCDGSFVSEKKRFHMLLIAQKAMKVFQQEGYHTFLYLERNGSKLQGVQHKHSHIIGIQQFPESFSEKVKTCLRQLYTPLLSEQALGDRIKSYQHHHWE